MLRPRAAGRPRFRAAAVRRGDGEPSFALRDQYPIVTAGMPGLGRHRRLGLPSSHLAKSFLPLFVRVSPRFGLPSCHRSLLPDRPDQESYRCSSILSQEISLDGKHNRHC